MKLHRILGALAVVLVLAASAAAQTVPLPSGGAAGEFTGDVTVDTSALEALIAETNVDLGAPGDAAATQGGTGSIAAKLRLLTSQINTLNSNVDQLEGYLDTVETLLGTSNTNTGGAAASLALLDDVLTPIAPATATATKGLLLGAQYNSTPPTFANGQQGGLQISAAGRLLATVDGAMSCSNCTGSGASDVEGSTFALGTDSVAPTGMYFDDVTPTAATEDRVTLPRVSGNRNQYMQIRDGANNERGALVTANNELLVELGAGSATIGVLGAGNNNIGDVDVASIAAGDNDIGNVDLELAGTAVGQANPVAVRFSDGTNFISLTPDPVHDAGITPATQAGPMQMGRSSAAAPTAVSADDEAVLAWYLRNGAAATVLTAGGALIGGDATNGLDIDVTRSVLPTGASTSANQSTEITSLQLLDDVIFTDDAGFTAGTSKVAGIGFVADNATIDSVDEDDMAAARMSLDRVAYAAVGATASAGASALECPVVSTASTNATNCKAAPGNFYGVELVNTTTTLYYLRLYNTSSAPTCSSGTGFVRSIPVPPATAAGGAGGIVRVSPVPVAYSTGMSYCLTAGGSSTDNVNAAAGIFGSMLYK